MKIQSILYISYDGMLEPLGQSQVLNYLDRLAQGRVIHLISFEKKKDWINKDEREKLAIQIANSKIVWHPLIYHKSPSFVATLWDIVCGFVLGLKLVIKHKVSVVHARSYVPSVIALLLKHLTGVKFLFDMRGFWVDERVDGGIWQRESYLFRVAKFCERRFLLGADFVVSLTHSAVREIERFDYLRGRLPPITVIPTCADLSRFHPLPLKVPSKGFVLGYVGSVGTWYLFEEVVSCFKQLLRLRPDSCLLILNRGEHMYIRDCLMSAGITENAFEIKNVIHQEVPSHITRMDAGIFFIRPSYSKQASAPTKLAEFLGCGIPCISNSGVGDMASIIEGERVGVVLNSFDDSSLAKGMEELLHLALYPRTSARCVSAAQKHFSVDEGVNRYATIYQQLTSAK